MSEFITNGELRMEAERLCDENERLETENAKLRLQIHWLKKGDVHVYEAGYHDGATNYELDHCPSCKNIADLQDALDENAKLREELEAVGMAAYSYGRGDLKTENAKLRELARAAWKCIHTGASCSDCRLIAGGCTLQTAMRELGVEV